MQKLTTPESSQLEQESITIREVGTNSSAEPLKSGSEMFNSSMRPQTLTDDAEGLGSRHVGPFVIGEVDAIVGEGGVVIPGFVATKNEILQRVRYWTTEILDLDFIFFLYGLTGSSEWRTRDFANRRPATISRLIGEKELTKAIRHAEQAYAKGIDPQVWKVFTEGTKGEQERFQLEVQETLDRAAIDEPDL